LSRINRVKARLFGVKAQARQIRADNQV